MLRTVRDKAKSYGEDGSKKVSGGLKELRSKVETAAENFGVTAQGNSASRRSVRTSERSHDSVQQERQPLVPNGVRPGPRERPHQDSQAARPVAIDVDQLRMQVYEMLGDASGEVLETLQALSLEELLEVIDGLGVDGPMSTPASAAASPEKAGHRGEPRVAPAPEAPQAAFSSCAAAADPAELEVERARRREAAERRQVEHQRRNLTMEELRRERMLPGGTASAAPARQPRATEQEEAALSARKQEIQAKQAELVELETRLQETACRLSAWEAEQRRQQESIEAREAELRRQQEVASASAAAVGTTGESPSGDAGADDKREPDSKEPPVVEAAADDGCQATAQEVGAKAPAMERSESLEEQRKEVARLQAEAQTTVEELQKQQEMARRSAEDRELRLLEEEAEQMRIGQALREEQARLEHQRKNLLMLQQSLLESQSIHHQEAKGPCVELPLDDSGCEEQPEDAEQSAAGGSGPAGAGDGAEAQGCSPEGRPAAASDDAGEEVWDKDWSTIGEKQRLAGQDASPGGALAPASEAEEASPKAAARAGEPVQPEGQAETAEAEGAGAGGPAQGTAPEAALPPTSTLPFAPPPRTGDTSSSEAEDRPTAPDDPAGEQMKVKLEVRREVVEAQDHESPAPDS